MADETKELAGAGLLGATPETDSQPTGGQATVGEIDFSGAGAYFGAGEIAMPEVKADPNMSHDTTKMTDSKAMPADLEGLLLEMEKFPGKRKKPYYAAKSRKAHQVNCPPCSL